VTAPYSITLLTREQVNPQLRRAVDITITGLNDKKLDMGTRSISLASSPSRALRGKIFKEGKLTEEQVNRSLLRNGCIGLDYTAYIGEWRHFEAFERHMSERPTQCRVDLDRPIGFPKEGFQISTKARSKLNAEPGCASPLKCMSLNPGLL